MYKDKLILEDENSLKESFIKRFSGLHIALFKKGLKAERKISNPANLITRIEKKNQKCKFCEHEKKSYFSSIIPKISTVKFNRKIKKFKFDPCT